MTSDRSHPECQAAVSFQRQIKISLLRLSLRPQERLFIVNSRGGLEAEISDNFASVD